MAVDINGVASIVVFFLLILFVGIWAARKTNSTSAADSEYVMLAGRNLPFLVGVASLSATWAGVYIIRTPEAIVTGGLGLAWTQAPFGYAISHIIGGIFFANKMRTEGYITILDPFQRKYGSVMSSLLYLPALMGEFFWASALLATFGSMVTVVLRVNSSLAIVASAGIVISYTLLGGLYAVAYTDVAKFVCILLGLWAAVPFSFMHRSMEGRSITAQPIEWLGSIELPRVALWLDESFSFILGCIAWQIYFQRVLSAKSPLQAQAMSFLSAVVCLFITLPLIIIGAIAKTADWNETKLTGHRNGTIGSGDATFILPLVLENLCPNYATSLGLGAITCAILASIDSNILAITTMFARNVYQRIFRNQGSEREIIAVMRVSIVLFGVTAVACAIFLQYVRELFVLACDFVYIILFPQLLCVLYFPSTNAYGSLAGYLFGIMFRFLGGDKSLGILAMIEYPGFQYDTMTQLFPCKTFAMLISFGAILLVSYQAKYLFQKNVIAKKWDLFRCFPINLECSGAKTRELKRITHR